MLVVRAALAGKSLPASAHRSVCCLVLAAPRHASWRRLALRARRRWRGRCAPGACGEPDLRLALRARRTALRAEGAARLCAGRRSRWLPSTARATRSAPMAWALRARAPAAARSRPRAARSAPMAWALRARAPTCCPPPVNVRVASWWWGCRRRRALRADRDACRKARFALLPRARVGRGVSDIIMHERAGQRLRASAACAVQVGAARHCNRSALSPGQADLPHFERARAAARRCSGGVMTS